VDFPEFRSSLYTQLAMTSYRVSAKDPNQLLFRISSCCSIILLAGVLALSLYDPPGLSDSTRRTIGIATGALVLTSVAGAYAFSAKGGMWKLKQSSQIQLSDDTITLVREGQPSVEIPLTQVEELHEAAGWLFVRGGEPRRHMAIPVEIEGYEELKGKLAIHRNVTPLKTKIPPLFFLPFVLTIVVYIPLLTSHILAIVIAAGFGALLLHGWGFYFLRRAYRRRPIPVLLMGVYLFSCLIIVWLVYERTKAIV
jgi:hypothetical protein